MTSTEEKSYAAHARWFEKCFPDQNTQDDTIRRWIGDKEGGYINYWIHQQMFGLADPLCEDPAKTWLTVGDGYGTDASYFFEKGIEVTATDISGTFLPIACSFRLIDKFSVENVEKLSFQNDSFDYVFCKESYHHFPRPQMGVYEMLRVAREGIVIIEPQDPISKMPFLLGLRNLADRFDTGMLRRLWKNQYSFEEVGNYVSKLSFREMEKLANGIGLPAMAVKGVNCNFYTPAVIGSKADNSSPVFRKIKRRKRMLDLLSSWSLIPEQVLCVMIFKKNPAEAVRQRLKKAGFRFYDFPANPYLVL